MEQSTTYPFTFPQRLIAKLPPSGQDGLRHVDVKFKGHWDGILVIDQDNNCIGVYASREIRQEPLPLKADDITDVRPARLLNRIMAAVPETVLWSLPYLYVLIVGPLLIVSSALLSPWTAVVGLPLGALAGFLVIEFIRGWCCITGIPLLLAILAECGLMLWHLFS